MQWRAGQDQQSKSTGRAHGGDLPSSDPERRPSPSTGQASIPTCMLGAVLVFKTTILNRIETPLTAPAAARDLARRPCSACWCAADLPRGDGLFVQALPLGMQPSSRLVMDFPVYGLSVLSGGAVAVAGGGGRMKSGIPNRVAVRTFDESAAAFDSPTDAAVVDTADAAVAVAASRASPTFYTLVGAGCKNYVYDAAARALSAESDYEHDIRVATRQEQSALAVSCDASTLAVASDAGDVRTLSLPDCTPMAHFKMHGKGVDNLDLSRGGTLVASTSARDRSSYLWESRTAKLLQRIHPVRGGDLGTHIRSVRFGPDDPSTLFTAESNPRHGAWVTVWRDTSTAGGTAPADGADYRPVASARVTADALTAMSVHADGRVAVASAEGHVALFRWSGASRIAKLWSTESRVEWLRPPTPPHFLPITAVAFSDTGQYVLAASADFTVTAWPARRTGVLRLTFTVLAWLLAAAALLLAVLIAEDGELPASVAHHRDRFEPHVTDARTAMRPRVLQAAGQLAARVETARSLVGPVLRDKMVRLQPYLDGAQERARPHLERAQAKAGQWTPAVQRLRREVRRVRSAAQPRLAAAVETARRSSGALREALKRQASPSVRTPAQEAPTTAPTVEWRDSAVTRRPDREPAATAEKQVVPAVGDLGAGKRVEADAPDAARPSLTKDVDSAVSAEHERDGDAVPEAIPVERGAPVAGPPPSIPFDDRTEPPVCVRRAEGRPEDVTQCAAAKPLASAPASELAPADAHAPAAVSPMQTESESGESGTPAVAAALGYCARESAPAEPQAPVTAPPPPPLEPEQPSELLVHEEVPGPGTGAVDAWDAPDGARLEEEPRRFAVPPLRAAFDANDVLEPPVDAALAGDGRESGLIEAGVPVGGPPPLSTESEEAAEAPVDADVARAVVSDGDGGDDGGDAPDGTPLGEGPPSAAVSLRSTEREASGKLGPPVDARVAHAGGEPSPAEPDGPGTARPPRPTGVENPSPPPVEADVPGFAVGDGSVAPGGSAREEAPPPVVVPPLPAESEPDQCRPLADGTVATRGRGCALVAPGVPVTARPPTPTKSKDVSERPVSVDVADDTVHGDFNAADTTPPPLLFPAAGDVPSLRASLVGRVVDDGSPTEMNLDREAVSVVSAAPVVSAVHDSDAKGGEGAERGARGRSVGSTPGEVEAKHVELDGARGGEEPSGGTDGAAHPGRPEWDEDEEYAAPGTYRSSDGASFIPPRDGDKRLPGVPPSVIVSAKSSRRDARASPAGMSKRGSDDVDDSDRAADPSGDEDGPTGLFARVGDEGDDGGERGGRK
jgi:hypothetical protein